MATPSSQTTTGSPATTGSSRPPCATERIGSASSGRLRALTFVLGRRSHDLAPNVRSDQRLVISRGAAGLEQHSNVWWWNPARMSWAEVAKQLLPRGGDAAVPGAQVVFDLFLKIVSFDARAWRKAPRGASALFGLRR